MGGLGGGLLALQLCLLLLRYPGFVGDLPHFILIIVDAGLS